MQDFFNSILDLYHYFDNLFNIIFLIIYYSVLFTIVNILAYATVKMLIIYLHMIRDLFESLRDMILYPILRLMFKSKSFFSILVENFFNSFENKRLRDEEYLEATKRAISNLSEMLDNDILEETYASIIPTYETLSKNRIEEAYSILGLSSHATYETVIQSYKALIRQYHPDRFSTAPKDILLYVQKRFSEIQKAFGILTDHLQPKGSVD